MRSIALLLLATACAGIAPGQTEGPDSRLKFCVILSRHGVRAPTWTPERLNAYSSQLWPDFGVPPSYLTPRGERLIELMGEFYGMWLREAGLLTGKGCSEASTIQIYADSDERTIRTGEAFSKSILSGCNIKVQHKPEGEADDLFDAGSGKPANQPIGTPEKFLGAFQSLQKILTGDEAAVHPVLAKDAVMDLAALNTASTLSEVMLLEYANGFLGKQLGWGRLTETNLLDVLRLHGEFARLTREEPSIATARCRNLLARILEAMKNATPAESKDKVLLIAGHDTNLSNIAGSLGIHWEAGGYQENETPPGGALAFLLYQDRTGRSYVRLRYFAQTLKQLREMTPLTMKKSPASDEVTIPGCGKAGCTWNEFSDALEKAIQKGKH